MTEITQLVAENAGATCALIAFLIVLLLYVIIMYRGVFGIGRQPSVTDAPKSSAGNSKPAPAANSEVFVGE
jgi:hypothetical protein